MAEEVREHGHPSKIRVVSCYSQLNKWWPDFLRYMGQYPVVGLNCRRNSRKVCQSLMAQQTADPDESPLPFGDGVQPEIEGDFHSDQEERASNGHETDPLTVRDENTKEGRISLIQLSSFGGHVILFRSCFFKTLPTRIRTILESNRVVKVGQGLEKDKKWLLESFGLSLAAFLDIRHLCCRWPYFAAHFDFQRFGIRSVAEFLEFEICDDSWGQLSPFWMRKGLDEDQIRVSAEQVQLYVDVFTLVLLRYLGQTIPRNWLVNPSFGQIMFYWSAPIFELSFLNSKFRPKAVTRCLKTAAKREQNRKLLGRIKKECSVQGSLQLASLWAWTLPGDDSELEKMMTRSPGAYFPAYGYPFLAVNFPLLLPKSTVEKIGRRDGGDFDSGETTMRMRTEFREEGRRKSFRITLSLSAIDEESLDGGDGGGPPLDFDTAFSDGSEWTDGLCKEELETRMERVRTAAEKAVPALAFQRSWSESSHSL